MKKLRNKKKLPEFDNVVGIIQDINNKQLQIFVL